MEELTRKEFQDGLSRFVELLGYTKDTPTTFVHEYVQEVGRQIISINGQQMEKPGTEIRFKNVFTIGDWGSIDTLNSLEEVHVNRLVEISLTRYSNDQAMSKTSQWVPADTTDDLERLKVDLEKWIR